MSRVPRYSLVSSPAVFACRVSRGIRLSRVPRYSLVACPAVFACRLSRGIRVACRARVSRRMSCSRRASLESCLVSVVPRLCCGSRQQISRILTLSRAVSCGCRASLVLRQSRRSSCDCGVSCVAAVCGRSVASQPVFVRTRNKYKLAARPPKRRIAATVEMAARGASRPLSQSRPLVPPTSSWATRAAHSGRLGDSGRLFVLGDSGGYSDETWNPKQ